MGVRLGLRDAEIRPVVGVSAGSVQNQALFSISAPKTETP